MSMGLFGGIAGAIGGIASTILGNNSAKDEAQKNREWQEQMSNTSISRRMQDLRNAGLNPLLAVDNASSGASTPVGSQAQIERFNPQWLTAFSSAKVANAQARQIDEQTKSIQNENSIFDVKAEKLKLEAEMQRQGILTEKTVQELNKANTLESKARILVHKAQAEGIKMSTEEAKRKIQLLDFEVGVYSNNPDLKEKEKYSDLTSTPAKVLGLGNHTLKKANEKLLEWEYQLRNFYGNTAKRVRDFFKGGKK